jgi:hypothetical protein
VPLAHLTVKPALGGIFANDSVRTQDPVTGEDDETEG